VTFTNPLTDLARVISVDSTGNVTFTQNIVSNGSAINQPASATNLGSIKIGSDLSISNGVANLATTAVTAGAYGNSTQLPVITIDSKGRITNAYTVAITGGGGGGNATVSNATTNSLGVVKIGQNISVDSNGVISVANATSSSLGVVKIGRNINFAADGTISVANSIAATTSWASVSVNGSDGLNELGVAIKSDGSLWAWGSPNQNYDLTSSGSEGGLFNQLGVGYSWTGVGTAYATGYAIRSDGLLFSWGDNSFGQTGLNSSTNQSDLAQIGSNSWKMISGGYGHALAIRSDGTLWAWGNNGTGQLGLNDKANRSSPVQVGTSSWSFVSAGNNNTSFGIRSDGTLWGWGYNTYGQIGDNTTINKSSPVQIGTSSWSFVTVCNHTAAIDATGRLFGWGNNNFGGLGDGTTVRKSSPVLIGSTYSWTSVGVGTQNITVAIRSDGSMWSTGYGAYYQLGNGSFTNTSSFSQIGSGTSWKYVTGEATTMVALSANGVLYGWGSPNFSGLGQAYGAAVSSPAVVASTGTNTYNTVLLGSDLTIGAANAINLAPTAVVAGTYGSSTQAPVITVDNKGRVTSLTTVSISGGGGGGGNVATASTTAAGIVQVGQNINVTANGTISVANASSSTLGLVKIGQNINLAGDGTISVANAVSATLTWSAVSVNGSDGLNELSLAIKSDGSLWAWGSPNQNYDLTSTGNTGGLFNQLGVGYSWSSVGTAYATGYAIRSDGLLFSWGDNSFGQTGLNSNTNQSTLAQIGSNSWKMISGGYGHALAIRSDGTLWAWGFNSVGQLGLNDKINKSSPVQVGTSSWSFVEAGSNNSSFGIKADGTLWGWGYNGYGQLGDNTTVDKSSPVQIGTSSWSFVTGCNHTAAIDVAGRLFAWGLNTSGGIGDNTTVSKSSPVLVDSSYSWTSVGIGVQNLTVAIRSDGSMWSTGYNGYYQLGTGNNTNYSSPVQIGAGTSWRYVTGESTTMVALSANGTLYGWGTPNFGALGQSYGAAVSSPVVVASTGTLNFNTVLLSNEFSVGAANTLSLASTPVSAGTYGSATQAPVITVDSKGRVTNLYTVSISGGGGGGNGNVATASTIAAGIVQIGQNINATANGTISVANASNSVAGVIKAGTDLTIDANAIANLSTTAVTAGTYGSGSAVPVVTIDTKGRITNAYTVSVTGGNIATASTTVSGLVQIGQNINVTGNGTISVDTFSSNITTVGFTFNPSSASNYLATFKGTSDANLLIVSANNNAVGVGTAPASGVKFDVSGAMASNILALANGTVNLSTGNFFTYTISSNTTFIFNNPPASRAFVFSILLTNGGGATVVWPTSVKWAAATAPTLTSGGVDLLTFATTDGGSTYRAIASLLDSR
jgi:alpha-tubulin suppressor-like RCC1 family protein